jgi:hypothetical protein
MRGSKTMAISAIGIKGRGVQLNAPTKDPYLNPKCRGGIQCVIPEDFCRGFEGFFLFPICDFRNGVMIKLVFKSYR